MQKSDFYYELPKDRIAQEPAEPRDSARMMVMDRKSGEIQHKIFKELPLFLEPGDLLVVNNSKVLPARLLGRKRGAAPPVRSCCCERGKKMCGSALQSPASG